MWIRKAAYEATQAKLDTAQEALNRAIQLQMETYLKLGGTMGEMKQLEIQNTRLRADLDWFKLRLNSVEKERAQLIAASIGVKVSVPEFMPSAGDAGQVRDAFQEMVDLTTVGGDAHDEPTGDGVDYSQMPGYRGGTK
jgi:hypothetical protein